MTCRTRFAPSPTGYLHIGGARTALYAWLHARQRGGQFLLRIEDTDRQRSTQAAIDAILQAMDWLGLDYDGQPLYQTARQARYAEVAQQLVEAGLAYYAYETREELEAMREQALASKQKPRYNGAARDLNLEYKDDPNRVIRFKNPLHGSVVFNDLVKGRIEIANSELDDMVIFRPDGWPTYNFAVVVDDWDMGITQVIRGDDHINNTPRQINIYHALQAPLPEFAHLPMILDEHGAKLSKRTGAADVMDYHAAGYVPQAVLNYLARLGWSHGDQEIFTPDQLLQLFDIHHCHASASRLDVTKLNWVNQQYLKTADPQTIAPQLDWQLQQLGLQPDAGPLAAEVVVALRERVHTLQEMAQKAAVWYQPLRDYDPVAVAKHLKPESLPALQAVKDKLHTLETWSVEQIAAGLRQVAVELGVGLGKVAAPVRVAITGTQVSPDISHTVYLTGRDQAIERITAACAKITAL